MIDSSESTYLFIDAWKTFIQRLPAGTITISDGIQAVLGNVELPIFNTCFHDRPLNDAEELREAIQNARKLASTCIHPWFFILGEDWAPQGWEAVVEETGLEPQLINTAMATDRLLPPRRPLPELEFRRIQDAETARDLAELNGKAYSTPLSMVECICNLYLWTEDAFGYVGYLGGVPVTCAAAFPVRETVYVAFVATHPGYGRKGYAEAVTRHTILQGMEGLGLSTTTLHASEAGLPIYAAMGFEGQSRFHLITEPENEQAVLSSDHIT